MNKENYKWLNVVQLEAKLQISRSTVNRWMKLGVIRGYRFEGARTLYFLESEIDEFLSNNLIMPSGRLDKVGMSEPKPK
ncbi:MAG: helix-turn-helix domain-containing protein [Bacteroidales bacterium]|nr:helix-turn-helix domain-containing protein [Bacteroidales bacterium]